MLNPHTVQASRLRFIWLPGLDCDLECNKIDSASFCNNALYALTAMPGTTDTGVARESTATHFLATKGVPDIHTVRQNKGTNFLLCASLLILDRNC